MVSNSPVKLSKKHYESEDIHNIFVDIDYTVPISEQINENLIRVICQTQAPILHIIHLFGMIEYSSYCCSNKSISDINNIFRVNSCTLLNKNHLITVLYPKVTTTKLLIFSILQTYQKNSTQIIHWQKQAKYVRQR